MEEKSCKNCGGKEFTEATDYMPVKPSKGSFRGAQKIYTFCLKCGEVDTIRLDNPEIFRK
ncbi:hypothetical protein [Halobacillus salinus]|uniref:Transcription initiation factor TFIIIB n=1 Tax=Halobacillus salinus TaxID=192814 RepID=A0A4Z0GZ20_9BACI|nr:hypothetical protein [Halobacillus salinus]TGB03472.1 hypothetical protein E4663_00245 [Halobacillus salinus]